MARAFITFLLVALACAAQLAGVSALISNAVADWNSALVKATAGYSIRHQVGLKYFALLHLSQLKALQRNRISLVVYNETVVIAVASHFALSTLLPDQQTGIFDGLISKQLVGVDASTAQAALSSVKPVITQLLLSRYDDGLQRWANYTAFPDGTTGKYQLTPNQTNYIYPQLGTSDTFWISLRSIPTWRRIFAPYALTNPLFLSNLNETFYVGSASSPDASNWTKDTADFWADGGGTSAHGGHWNVIAIQLLPATYSLFESAHALALLNALAYDASIVTWNLKYFHQFWRPITAIRAGYGTFAADPTWTPYLATPAHPEYPSGHSTTAGAFGAGLTLLLGSDAINVTIGTEGKSQTGSPLPLRSYTSLSSIVTEINFSRIYGGIHFRKAVVDGATWGSAIVRQYCKDYSSYLSA